jgi:uncharacterized protein (DUF1697 family)
MNGRDISALTQFLDLIWYTVCMQSNRKSFIAFLRGINVGGHNVRMEQLRSFFEALGFDNVRSYIQSGNIFFDSDEYDKLKLRKKIEEFLYTSLGYKVVVCIRTIEDLKQLLSHDPFKNIKVASDIRFAVTFLAEETTVDLPLPYLTPDGGYELIAKTSTELFIVWHLQNGRPSSSYSFIEKKVKSQATTRFWHTLAKILLAAQLNE